MEITSRDAKKILKNAGAARVSDSAAAEFASIINKYAYTVANKAVKLTKHAKRATVQREDVELAD